MKSIYLLLFSGILLSFTACHKDNSAGSSQVDGKWLQTSLRIYGDSDGIKTYDTTYTKPFTSADFIQFKSGGTCGISTDHYYYPNIGNYPKTPQAIPATVGDWNFNLIGNSTYVLTQQGNLTNPGGFEVTDTVKVLSANTLWLHVVFYSHAPGLSEVTDSYYKK